MFKKVILWISILVGVVVLFWAMSPSSNDADASDSRPVAGMLAPDFTLPATDGSSVSLSDFRGKQNVLIYFSEGLTCDPCMQQIPELDKYVSALSALDVKVLSITMDSVNVSRSSMSRFGIRMPIYSYINDPHITQDYDLLPYSMGMGNRAGHTFVLVGKDGKILWRKDYWPSRGMSVAGGTMFVDGKEIVAKVTNALGENK